VTGILVRIGTPADIREAEAVWRDSVTARDGHPPSTPVVEVVGTVLHDAETRLFVAEQADRLVGMACTTPGRDAQRERVEGLCHIQMIFVRAEQQGQGIGGRLLDTVIEDARRREMHTAQLWVVEGNDAATRLYEGRGFRHSGRVVEEEGALISLWVRNLAGPD
jgi:ribosomal protein S18 acetylase RimI-like enzyme